MSWVIWLVVIVGVLMLLYAVACTALAFLFTQTNQAWTWPLRASPRDVGLSYDDVTFTATDKIRLSGWWLPSAGGTAVVMIPGGGANRLLDNNQMSSEAPTDAIEIASELTSRGHDVLMYDSRGTGGSEGERLSYGSLEARDLAGALDWLAARGLPPQHVAVLAWSMGCATAMFALDERTYAGLIADSPLGGFSTDDVAGFASRAVGIPPIVARPMTAMFMRGVFVAARLLWGMSLGAQPADMLRAHPIPTLVIHGRADRQIPVRVGEQVAAAAGSQLIGAHFLDGVDHMGAYRGDKAWYIATIADALDVMFAGAPIPQSAGE